jgi:hypothetical protein
VGNIVLRLSPLRSVARAPRQPPSPTGPPRYPLLGVAGCTDRSSACRSELTIGSRAMALQLSMVRCKRSSLRCKLPCRPTGTGDRPDRSSRNRTKTASTSSDDWRMGGVSQSHAMEQVTSFPSVALRWTKFPPVSASSSVSAADRLGGRSASVGGVLRVWSRPQRLQALRGRRRTAARICRPWTLRGATLHYADRPIVGDAVPVVLCRGKPLTFGTGDPNGITAS